MAKKAKTLDEESAGTPADSPSDQETPVEDAEESAKLGVKEPASETENEFGKLSGSTQDRIRELLRRAKESEDRAKRLESELRGRDVGTQPVSEPPSDDEVMEAVKKLKEYGVIIKDDAVGQLAAISAVAIWTILIFLMAFKVISF